MNGFDLGTVDFITSQANFLISSAGLSPSQVVLGFPASPSSAGSGYIESIVVQNAINCLGSGNNCGSFVPDVNFDVLGVSLWSINSDTASYSSQLLSFL